MLERNQVFEQFYVANLTIWEEIRADGVNNVFSVGNLVRIANYSPFHGRKGIIRKVDCIFDDGEEPFCFYLVALEA